MNENTYALYVRNPGVFWHSLQSWVKRVIVVVGGLIGLLVWFTGFSASFLFIMLMFLGTAPAANYVKILIIVVNVASLLIIPLITTWLLRLIIYAIARLIITKSEDASMGDFIFKKE